MARSPTTIGRAPVETPENLVNLQPSNGFRALGKALAACPAGVANSAIREAIRGGTVDADDAADQPGIISPAPRPRAPRTARPPSSAQW